VWRQELLHQHCWQLRLQVCRRCHQWWLLRLLAAVLLKVLYWLAWLLLLHHPCKQPKTSSKYLPAVGHVNMFAQAHANAGQPSAQMAACCNST
jgi:hypothetical protein